MYGSSAILITLDCNESLLSQSKHRVHQVGRRRRRSAWRRDVATPLPHPRVCTLPVSLQPSYRFKINLIAQSFDSIFIRKGYEQKLLLALIVFFIVLSSSRIRCQNLCRRKLGRQPALGEQHRACVLQIRTQAVPCLLEAKHYMLALI